MSTQPESRNDVITRFTLSYIAEEDRIRLVGLFSSGEKIKLWLTQRLISRLEPLIQKLRPPDQLDQNRDEPMSHFSSFDSSHVECDQNTESFLVNSIDINHQSTQIVLTFHGFNSKDRVILGLSTLNVNKWLVAIKECCKLAKWPQGVWAAVRDTPANQLNPQNTVH